MTTQIFASKVEFDRREDKNVNGVTQEWLDERNLTLDDINSDTTTLYVGCWNSYGNNEDRFLRRLLWGVK